jgi:hypothetical protein
MWAHHTLADGLHADEIRTTTNATLSAEAERCATFGRQKSGATS